MTKDEAIKIFGTQERLAEALNISQPAISRFNDDRIPELREFQIERIGQRLADGLNKLPGIILGF